MIFARSLVLSFCFTLICSTKSYALDSKFSIDEFIATINMNFCQMGVINDTMSCKPRDWQRLYRSPIVGLENRFDIWKRDSDGLVGISMRGTTPRAISWMENFYATMVPAQGSLQINNALKFDYCFAKRKDAAVHVGWTYALGAMHVHLLEQIKAQYALGSKDFLIFGHSQGGALSYLAFAYFHYLQKDGSLPQDIRFKMVTSAAPKAGNILFAYDFESYTPSSWAFNVINPEDWIPLMPFSVQTTEDMTATQPFVFIKQGLKKQKLLSRITLSTLYKSMNRKLRKARKSLKNNLGKRVGKQIQNQKQEFPIPEFHHSMNYCRAGNHIILEPTEEYYKKFPQTSDDIFIHHMLDPYLLLAELNREKFK